MAQETDKAEVLVNQIFETISKLTNEQCDELRKRLCNIKSHYDDLVTKRKDVFEKTRRLTVFRLIQDLQDAVKFNKGYYKNDAGEFYYFKGVEIDGSCDLFRGGFNAEDRGVYVHYSSISKYNLFIGDMNIIQVAYMMTCTEPDKILKPCTEEEFDEAYTKFTSKLKYEPEVCEDPQLYLDTYNEYVGISDEQVNVAKEIFKLDDDTYRNYHFAAGILEELLLCKLD